jgi:nucleotide-binding universal stress UspA family protein
LFNHLLVPLDGSPFAAAAVPYAQALAGKFGSAITLVRIILPPRFNDGALTVDSADLLVRVRNDLYEEAIAYVQDQQAALQSEGYEVHYLVVEAEDIAAELMQAVADTGADALVMCTHGRGGLSRFLFGSVAARVLQIATVPVLVVRPVGAGLEG